MGARDLNSPIDFSKLSIRARRCLGRVKATTYRDLCGMTRADVLGIKNAGKYTVCEIEDHLSKLGMGLMGTENSCHQMKKNVRDQHRRELTSQIVGFVWLGDMLEYLSDTLSQVKAPHIPDVAGMSVKLADAVLDALEEREQSSV